MYSVLVLGHGKKHHDRYVYAGSKKRWVRFWCDLDNSMDCTFTSTLAYGASKKYNCYIRTSNLEERDAIENALQSLDAPF